ncbi:alpha/beta fold hydrolase [Halocalculus aciditolerans]|uniref:Hydrolase n=1 Tax=Halocalculus aciditolerans TaxID=1383812 RepID=A0A830FE98_9EURY|nr:alpha/beta hydrolase [Halocalculus aciditolerans]GGL46303.1 hydrolase [Halocalculus aciditolerans]
MDRPAGWTAERVDVDAATLQAYRVGDPADPPLVVLHGFYENAACRYRLAGDLSEDYHVVLYDARGHGESDAPESGYGIDARIADLVGVCDALDLSNPILYGHSMGGSTAAWTAVEHPDVPRAVVLEDPAGMRPEPGDPGPAERAAFVRENVAELAGRSVDDLRTEYDDPDSERAHRQALADSQLRPQIAEIARLGYPHLADAFPDVQCPTLVLRRDGEVTERVTDLQMADQLQNGRLVHVPDAGHHVLRDEYDAAFRELRAFLRRVENRETGAQ